MRPIDPPYTAPKIHRGKKAEDVWYVYFRYWDKDNQKWKLFIRKMGINFYPTKKEKDAEITRLRQYIKMKLESGWNPISNQTEIRQTRELLPALEAELENRLPTMRPRSKDSFRSIFGIYKKWLIQRELAHIDISLFDTPLAREYLDHVGRERHYAGKTLNVAKGVLSVLFNGLVKRELIYKNPFAGVPRYKEQSGAANQAFSTAERMALIEWMKSNNAWLYCFTQVMYYCFIRRAELYRLRVENVSLHGNTITVPAAASKNGKTESVVIPRNLLPILHAMELHRYPPHFYIFGMAGNGTLGPAEEPVTNKNYAYNAHVLALKALQIPNRTLYSWKHSGVCAAYHATNGDIYAIMRQLRHYDLKMTQIYLKSLGLTENTAMAGDW
jgi:integrase